MPWWEIAVWMGRSKLVVRMTRNEPCARGGEARCAGVALLVPSRVHPRWFEKAAEQRLALYWRLVSVSSKSE